MRDLCRGDFVINGYLANTGDLSWVGVQERGYGAWGVIGRGRSEGEVGKA